MLPLTSRPRLPARPDGRQENRARTPSHHGRWAAFAGGLWEDTVFCLTGRVGLFARSVPSSLRPRAAPLDLATFEAAALREWQAIPEAHRAGIVALIVERDARYDPDLPDVPLLGECVVDTAMSYVEAPVHSTIHLYFGSFVHVAAIEPDFDWLAEVRETLHHELTHHLEWRAGHDALGEREDVERENLGRLAGEPFDPTFYRYGVAIARQVFQVADEGFLEVWVPPAQWPRLLSERCEVRWGGWCFTCCPLSESNLADDTLFAEIEDGWDESEPADTRVDAWAAVTLVFCKRRTWLKRKKAPAFRFVCEIDAR